jgi:hypothetical protein
MSGVITYVHIFRSSPDPMFSRNTIFIVQNDPKMKNLATLITEIGLRIAKKN